MISVVTWLWGDRYSPEYVNRLYRAFARNYRKPFAFWCVSNLDLPELDPEIRVHREPERFCKMYDKGCYRRIPLYSKEFGGQFGTRILQLDVDMVITGGLTRLLSVRDPVKVWRSPSGGLYGFARNPSMILFDVGALEIVSRRFAAKPKRYMRLAAKTYKGTDQAIVSYFTEDAPTWTEADGIYSFRNMPQPKALPNGAKIVSFHGERTQEQYDLDWIREYWR